MVTCRAQVSGQSCGQAACTTWLGSVGTLDMPRTVPQAPASSRCGTRRSNEAGRGPDRFGPDLPPQQLRPPGLDSLALTAQACGTRVWASRLAGLDIHQTPLGIYSVALKMGHVMHRVSVPDTPKQATPDRASCTSPRRARWFHLAARCSWLPKAARSTSDPLRALIDTCLGGVSANVLAGARSPRRRVVALAVVRGRA